jgi:hypothetical protein
VRHRGDVGRAEQLQQLTGAQLRLAQLDTAEVAGELGGRRRAVDADDPAHGGITGEPRGDAGAQIPADARDNDDGRPGGLR